jgi:hypothetical protein
VSEETESFVLVVEGAEVRRHVPDWPADILLAAAARDGAAPEIRRIAPSEITAFARGLPVIPLRHGHPCATPTAETEARVLASALERARSLVAELETAPAAEDQFSDIAGTSAQTEPAPRFLIRRSGKGFELRTVGLERFPWDLDRISIGASMFGASFVEQPLDRMLTFSVSVADLGPMAPMASFLPKQWTEVPLADGPSGSYFDVSPVLLGEVARRVHRATLISATSLGLLGFLVAAAIAAAVWSSAGHPVIW